MMSKKQWFVLLGLLIIYILLGAWFFYITESKEEAKKREIEREERKTIAELLHKHYVPTVEDTKEEILEKLADYCGKPMKHNVTDEEDPAKWDYYHSVFFVITVVTTVGYGNLAPTTSLGRIFMIFYALIGVPVNGIVMVALGDFFGKSFISLYRRWKTVKMEYDTTKLNLIAQIVLYLVPGFTFFIFLPAVIIMVFEGWDYTLSVYYAFVTLTTIGFGDYVAGVNQPGQDSIIYTFYKLFLLVWIIIGLGYVLMVLGFISSGLKSKRMHAIEHALAVQIKQTPRRIRSELRALVHEFLLLKVKRVYKDEFLYTPTELKQSQSCPDLRLYKNMDSPATHRKRALSECVPTGDLVRVQSDTELNLIDKERTFNRKISEQSVLLLRVANALSGIDNDEEDSRGVNGFSDEEILSNTTDSAWTTINKKTSNLTPLFKRRRAFSEVKFPFGDQPYPENDNNFTWYGPSSTVKLQQIREETQNSGRQSRTLSTHQPLQPSHLLSKLKNTLVGPWENKQVDIEKQEIVPRRNRLYSVPNNKYKKTSKSSGSSVYPTESVLEETSLADFLRILTDLSVQETQEASLSTPQRKFGTASFSPPKLTPPRSRRVSINPLPQSRRGSLISPPQWNRGGRRFSLRPVLPEHITILNQSERPTLPSIFSSNPTNMETNNSPPPPYTPFPSNAPGRRSIRVPGSNRRFSLRPVTLAPTVSSLQRPVVRLKEKDDSKEDFNEKL